MTDSSVPKYQTVHDEILKRLEIGYYSIGTRLPSEDVLSKTFGVSRVTVRKALDILVRDGYLNSRQGSGYTVTSVSPPSSTCMVSFTDQVLVQGQMPGAQLLSVENPTKRVPEAVKTLFDEPLVRVDRLRTIDNRPRMLTQTWIPARHVIGMTERDFPETGQAQSILRILRRTFGLTWSSACETIDSVLVDPDVAKWLDIDFNTPVISQACTAFDAHSNPVFFDQVYRQGPINFNLYGGSVQHVGT